MKYYGWLHLFMIFDHIKGMKNLGLFRFNAMPLALESKRKEGCDRSSFVIKSLFLVSSFLIFFIPRVGCKTPGPSKMYWPSKE